MEPSAPNAVNTTFFRYLHKLLLLLSSHCHECIADEMVSEQLRSGPPTSCGFMRLPTELRLLIYSYFFSNVLVIPSRTKRLRDDEQGCHTAIMRVNECIYSETSSMLYESCALQIRISNQAPEFLCGRVSSPWESQLIFQLSRI